MSSERMRVVEPRPAATVVVARPADPGVEVLLLRRSESTPFAPGFLVFPGGLIEEGDRDLALRWFGDRGEAARACALRELYEEAGLLLVEDGLEERPERRPLADLAFRPPPAAALSEMARWIAPEFLEVRFDARFYAVAAPGDIVAHPDGVEADGAWWVQAEEVLRRSIEGDASLMWPTLITLEALVGCRTVEDVLVLRVEQIEPGREEREARIRGAWQRPRGQENR